MFLILHHGAELRAAGLTADAGGGLHLLLDTLSLASVVF